MMSEIWISYGIDPLRLRSLEEDPGGFIEELEGDEPRWFEHADRAFFDEVPGESARVARAMLAGERVGERVPYAFIERLAILVSHHMGQRLENIEQWEEEETIYPLLAQWFDAIDAPEELSTDKLSRGCNFVPALEIAGGWFEPDEVDELDDFFIELDDEMREEAMERLESWEREPIARASSKLESWFAECAARGWGLAIYSRE